MFGIEDANQENHHDSSSKIHRRINSCLWFELILVFDNQVEENKFENEHKDEFVRSRTRTENVDLNLQDMRKMIFRLQLKEKGIDK
jgi:ABC-type transport system involved in Fe-S cluster assembly fused permease/ATPase subunit